jgi:hypothetical protein
MDADKDLLLHKLKSRIYDLEEENANYKKNLSLARKFEFRITGALLLIIGTVISLIAYPAYTYSNLATVLVMVGIGAIFLGAITMFLTTEKFINQKVAEHLNLSSVIVLDDLLRDFRIRNKGIYLPSSKTESTTKIFVPLRREYELPTAALLKGDRAFIIDLPNASQEGVLLKPLGYHLFKYTGDELKVDWHERETEDGAQPSLLSEKLNDVFVRGLEIADKVTAATSDRQFTVTIINTPYASTCRALMEDAPQVCEQIGCPLCSLVACIYTEYTDDTITIEESKLERRNIRIVCKTVP